MTSPLVFFWAMLSLPTADLPAQTAQVENVPAQVAEEETPSPLPLAEEEETLAPVPLGGEEVEGVEENTPPLPLPPPPPPPPSAPPAEAARIRFQMGKGVLLSSADEAFDLRVRAMAQLRLAFTPEGEDTNVFSARSVRLLLEGRAFEKRLVLRVQTGLSPDEMEGGSGLLDAWVSWTFGKSLTLRLGQQRVFYDLSGGLARDGNHGITRESASREFGMGRDIGIALFTEDLFGWKEWLACRVGVYSGKGRNRLDTRSGFLAMARLTLRPFGYFDDTVEGDVERLANPRLAVGLSAAYNSHITRAGGHNGRHFDSADFPAMDASYWNADAMFKWKGLYVAGQYSRRVTTRAFVENDTERVWGRSGHGYAFKVGGMLGARWELLGRFGQQFGIGRTEPALLEQLKNEFAVGLNHYFIGHALKAQVEYSARFTQAKVLYQDALRLQLQAVF